MKLHIKNMVCKRCIMAVKTELIKLGLNPIYLSLGEVEITNATLTATQSDNLTKALNQLGFEILGDRKKQIAEKVKTLIIALIHIKDEPLKVNLSAYLSAALDMEYTAISALFSDVEDNTIEKYYISQKIEKAKELLTYNEKSLSEIAFLLNYSSVAHLSAQFKKITGQTPSAYKSSAQVRKTLDEV